MTYLTPTQRLTRDFRERKAECNFESVVRLGFHLMVCPRAAERALGELNANDHEGSVHDLTATLFRLLLARGTVESLDRWLERIVGHADVKSCIDEDLLYLCYRWEDLDSLMEAEESYAHVVRQATQTHSKQFQPARSNDSKLALNPFDFQKLIEEVDIVQRLRKHFEILPRFRPSTRSQMNIRQIVAELVYATALVPPDSIYLLGVDRFESENELPTRVIDAYLILGLSSQIQELAVANDVWGFTNPAAMREGFPAFIAASCTLKIEDIQRIVNEDSIQPQVQKTRLAIQRRVYAFAEFISQPTQSF